MSMTASGIARPTADPALAGRRKLTYRDEFGDIRRRGRLVPAKAPVAVPEHDAHGTTLSVRGSLAHAAV